MPRNIFNNDTPIKLTKSGQLHEGIFTFGPLEQGFGHTIGNSLRRVLLSSLKGYAITNVELPAGTAHEFGTIDGVSEDMTEIILNLKQVQLKKLASTPLSEEESKEHIKISFKNQETFRAGDLNKVSSLFEVLNPDLVICTMDKSAEFSIGFTVQEGKGYMTADENAPAQQELGYVPIDSIFTPIKNVKYRVEDVLVGQKVDYEQVVIEVTTNKSITAEEAIEQAAALLVRYFRLFTAAVPEEEQETALLPSELIEKKEEELDQAFIVMRDLLHTPLDKLALSARAYNTLRSHGMTCLGHIVAVELKDILKLRNFGEKSESEIIALLDRHNLAFGMDVKAYGVELPIE